MSNSRGNFDNLSRFFLCYTRYMTNLRKHIPFLAIVLFLSALFSFFLFRRIHWPTEDLGRHLMNGKLLLEGKTEILYKNVYSYTYPDYPFLNHHWLTGVLYFVLFRAFSLPSLYLLNAGVLILGLMFTLKRMQVRSSPLTVALLGFPLALLLSTRVVIRP